MSYTSIRPVRSGEFLVSDSGSQSREVAVIIGANLPVGTVLGRVTASARMTQLSPGAADGSQTAAAILYASTMAAEMPVKATIIARNAEVNDALLIWPDAISDADKTAALADLAALGIRARS